MTYTWGSENSEHSREIFLMKKRVFVFTIILVVGSVLLAQNLVVKKTDGTMIRIPITDIVSMTFEEDVAVGSKPLPPKIYSVGDSGPAGGIIFYDKGSFSDGWRYIEMAPASAEGKYKPWYKESDEVFKLGTQESIGSSRTNTKAIVDKYKSSGMMNTPKNWAASYCDTLDFGGYNDWVLPSIEEMTLMYTSLHKSGKGGFSNNEYWTSSEYDGYNVWFINFGTGSQYVMARGFELSVRPVRYF
jgi:hypothetical protein